MATKNPAAVALAKARLTKMTPEERSEVGRIAAAARWEGHDAKRPASSRNTGKPVGRPPGAKNAPKPGRAGKGKAKRLRP